MLIDTNQGKRLKIRRCCEQDADFVWEASQNGTFLDECLPDFVEGMTIDSLKKTLSTLTRQNPTETGSLYFTIEHASLGLIGVAILVDYTPVHRRSEQVLAIPSVQHRNKGYGVEAELLLLDLAFNHYDVAKLYGHAFDFNPQGHAMALRGGFVDEGVMREHIFSSRKGRYINLHVHGMLESEFRDSPIVKRLSERLLGRDITKAVKHD